MKTLGIIMPDLSIQQMREIFHLGELGAQMRQTGFLWEFYRHKGNHLG